MRVGFHLLWEFHHTMLDPIYSLLKDEFACLMTDDVDAIVKFSPQVLLLADTQYHLFRERWVEDANIWYTRVVGYVIHEKNK